MSKEYSSPVEPLYEVDANICWTLLFQDKNETSPWAAEPVPCIKISQFGSDEVHLDLIYS